MTVAAASRPRRCPRSPSPRAWLPLDCWRTSPFQSIRIHCPCTGKNKSCNASPRRLIHYTPLRYPGGGKGKLASYFKSVIEANALEDGTYVEPYAGGAAIALELLFHEYVSKIHINDISRPVHAFWKCVLDHTEEFVRLIRNRRLTVRSWDKQKQVITHANDYDDLALGFATFFLNRTNRSGILNGGIIGGRDQSGPWKIDARFNVPELIFRIESIAKLRGRMSRTAETDVPLH